jgi:FtsP/CotA-like multicopper oxidase with cupredoxin domain
MKHLQLLARRALIALGIASCTLGASVEAAVPGITGPTFSLRAGVGYSSQPDGANIYSWGYGCKVAPTGFAPTAMTNATSCPQMQLPGPTMIVTQGQTVTVTLVNELPAVAGNTSIIFPGFKVTSTDGAAGLLVQEAENAKCGKATCASTVTYTFTADKPGTYAYYSGSQPEVQVEMGLFGAIIVLPAAAPANCKSLATGGDFRLATAAYNHKDACYDREYLMQFSEMNSRVHEQVLAQAQSCEALTGSGTPCPPLAVDVEPFRPNYYLINGRSMPDIMDGSFVAGYPSQPYNGNPHMLPGELMLMRIIGQGRWQHPFHFHGNHARVLARDGNMLVSQSGLNADGTPSSTTPLAGPLLFTTPTVPGQSQDQIFTWTGQGLNWDVYGGQTHTCNNVTLAAAKAAQANPAAPGSAAVLAQLRATPFDTTTKEYCPDHGKPFPVVPPDPQIVANGQWYGGTPYLGLSGFDATNLAPGTLNQNPTAGYAYMWHSHNEREITTNDVFPGGMMMMLIIDPPGTVIDETQ